MAITITTGRPLFQREIYDGVTSKGPVTIAGTYDGSPTSITISIRKVSDDTEVASGVDAAPAGGVYSITVVDVPESILANASGDLYYAHATAAGTGDTASSKGAYEFHVGRIFPMAGQSNGLRMISQAASPPAAATGTYYFNGSSWAEVPNANGIRSWLNEMVSRFGVPIGSVVTNVTGSSLDYFSPSIPGVGWTALAGDIAQMGGDIEGLQWIGGESAAVSSGAYANRYPVAYAALMDEIHDALATLTSRTKAQVPILISGLGREISDPAAYTEFAWHRATQCLYNAARVNTSVHLSHGNLDSIMGDDIHFTAAFYEIVGQRLALGWARVFGLETSSCLWEVTAASVVSNTVTRVTVNADATKAGDFTGTTSTSGLTGFEVSADGITWIPATGVKVDSTTIDLTHVAAPYSNRAVRYGYGKNPDISNAPIETLYGTPPYPSFTWVVDEQDSGANAIIHLEEMYFCTGVSGDSRIIDTPVVGYGVGVTYVLFTHGNATTVSNIQRNTVNMTTVASDSTSNAQARLSSQATTADSSSIVVNFASNPFGTTQIRPFTLLAGTLSVLDVEVERDTTSPTTPTLAIQTVDDGLVLTLGIASGGTGNAILSGNVDNINLVGGQVSSATAYATQTSATSSLTLERTSSTNLVFGAVTFGFGAPIELGEWVDMVGETNSTLITTEAGPFRCVVSGFGDDVISAEAARIEE